MNTSRITVSLIIGLIFLISLIVSKDFTLVYVIIIGLFLMALAYLWLTQIKTSFILSSILIVAYSYQIGVFFHYSIQDFIPNISPEDRILGYKAIATLPFLFLSLLSIWFIHKSIKTTKYSWYIGFVVLSVLGSLGGDEGYGSNYLFKIVLLAINVISFKEIKKDYLDFYRIKSKRKLK